MAAQIITSVQQKGGSGKTTMLGVLASLMAEDGARVFVVDTDEQRSAFHFCKAVCDHGLDIDFESIIDQNVIVPAVRKLAASGDYDVILIDTPGIDSKQTDVALHLTDLALMPVKPTRPDVYGLVASTKTIERIAELRGKPINAFVVYSDVDKNARITKAWETEIKQLPTPFISSRLYHRTGFREFLSSGRPLAGSAREVGRSFLGALQIENALDFYKQEQMAAE